MNIQMCCLQKRWQKKRRQKGIIIFDWQVNFLLFLNRKVCYGFYVNFCKISEFSEFQFADSNLGIKTKLVWNSSFFFKLVK